MPYINNIQPSAYFAGQIADSNPKGQISGINATANPINFGLAMVFDPTSQGFIVPTAASDIKRQMAVNAIINRNKYYKYDVDENVVITDNSSVASGGMCNGYVQGTVAVLVEDAVQSGFPCFIRYAAGAGGTILGSFRSDDDTATAAAQPNWYFYTAAAAGTIALVHVI